MRNLKLNRADLAEQIELKYHQEKDTRKKTRLLAMRLAAKGEMSASEIAKICGCSRASIFIWLRAFRSGGFEELLEGKKPGPAKGERRGISVEVSRELDDGIINGRWCTVEAARRWLWHEHKIQKKYTTVWEWIKKAGGVLRVPRPKHPGQNKEAVLAFKNELSSRLEALGLPQGSKVKIWVMDEARFGLHTEVRKVWIKKGTRPVIPRQTRYEWDYLYGALEVVKGEAEFLHLPTVNLDCNKLFLEHLKNSDPEAQHIVIADQAGFHLKAGDERLPEGVHILSLPPYSPELNPCEQLWDVLKDTEGFANGLFKSIKALREALAPGLQLYWEDPALVLSLIGRPWLHLQANSLSKI